MYNVARAHYCTYISQIMKGIILCTVLIVTSIVHGIDEYSRCSGDDWIAYKDEKCVKLFKMFLTRHQAEEVCNQQGPVTGSFAPSLVTINSATEQKFLTEYIFDSSDSNNVWIGAERRLDNITEFNWSDGSLVQRFTNWATGHPTDNVIRSCVQMRSPFTRNVSEMQWVDVSCTSSHWFICQKFQAWPIEHFQQIILNMRKEMQELANDLSASQLQIADLRNDLTSSQLQITSSQSQITASQSQITVSQSQIAGLRSDVTASQSQIAASQSQIAASQSQISSLQTNPVPIGFIYVQLPNQPEPRNTWPTVGWTEISSQYAGLFFRVVGGGSAAFGTVQAENSPRITDVSRGTFTGNNPSSVVLHPGSFSWPISTGATSTGATFGLDFFTSSGEVRPRNQAIRIWRRI